MRVILIALVAILASCSTRNKEYADGVYSIWMDTPVYIGPGSNFPREWVPALKAAVLKWKMDDRYLLIYSEDYPVVKINVLNNWPTTHQSNQQAYTSIFWSAGFTIRSEVFINKEDFKFCLETCLYDEVHLESLLVHELGHVLGLKHRPQGSGVMEPYLGYQTIRNVPTYGELNVLHGVYDPRP